MERKTHVVSEATVAHCMRDSIFFSKVPEYTPLRVKAKTAHVELKAPRSCAACAQRKIGASLLKDFNAITGALSADGVQRLKAYLGVDALMLRQPDGNARVL